MSKSVLFTILLALPIPVAGYVAGHKYLCCHSTESCPVSGQSECCDVTSTVATCSSVELTTPIAELLPAGVAVESEAANGNPL